MATELTETTGLVCNTEIIRCGQHSKVNAISHGKLSVGVSLDASIAIFSEIFRSF